MEEDERKNGSPNDFYQTLFGTFLSAWPWQKMEHFGSENTMECTQFGKVIRVLLSLLFFGTHANTACRILFA
jgi:hypothetical protein